MALFTKYIHLLMDLNLIFQ